MKPTELALRPLRRYLAHLITRGLALIDGVLNPYRPELYYMRGPGPKCRARRQVALRD
jgi:hypothetical protein